MAKLKFVVGMFVRNFDNVWEVACSCRHNILSSSDVQQICEWLEHVFRLAAGWKYFAFVFSSVHVRLRAFSALVGAQQAVVLWGIGAVCHCKV